MTDAPDSQGSEPQPSPREPLWSFRGHELGSGEFVAAMAHLYRGELDRANVWRERLDVTTNWAVLTAGAILTIAFRDPQAPHIVIPLGTLLVFLFLYIESRRYVYYELFTGRVRALETEFFGAMLARQISPDESWARSLAGSLLVPEAPISMWEALGRRLRRIYLVIFGVLAASWVFKILIHPVAVSGLEEFILRAQVGPLPGSWVIAAGLLFNGALAALAVFTLGLHEARGEIEAPLPLQAELERLVSTATHDLHLPGEGSQLAFIITDRAPEVSQGLMDRLKRGVTRMKGEGAFTEQEHGVLLCALAPREVGRLRQVVAEVDPSAFVVISPARGVFGGGFQSLKR